MMSTARFPESLSAGLSHSTMRPMGGAPHLLAAASRTDGRVGVVSPVGVSWRGSSVVAPVGRRDCLVGLLPGTASRPTFTKSLARELSAAGGRSTGARQKDSPTALLMAFSLSAQSALASAGSPASGEGAPGLGLLSLPLQK